MPQATFYQLSAKMLTLVEQRRASCRVVAKAWQVLGRVDVLLPDAGTLTEIDNFLWTFHAGSFIPHGADPMEPVYLFLDPGLRRADAPGLILMEWDRPEIPLAPPADRLIDFIPAAVAARASARERYRQCKQAGYSMQVHPLES